MDNTHAHTHTLTHTHTHTHTHTRILFSHKKEGNPDILTTWMDLKDMLSEKKSGGERQILYDLTHMLNLKMLNS